MGIAPENQARVGGDCVCDFHGGAALDEFEKLLAHKIILLLRLGWWLLLLGADGVRAGLGGFGGVGGRGF